MSGSARPKITNHGTTFITRAISTARLRNRYPKSNVSWRLRNCSSRRAAIGTGGTDPSIILLTIASLTNSIASISRTFIRLWAPLRQTIWLSRSWAEWLRLHSCRKPITFILTSRGEMIRYFEWMGAAHYTADRRSGSMHGKVFLLDSVYAGIDQTHVYGRIDFSGGGSGRRLRDCGQS